MIKQTLSILTFIIIAIFDVSAQSSILYYFDDNH